jgi:hypothetical protein
MNKTTNTILHGEAMIFGIDSIPATAKPMKVQGSKLIIAPSETTGNHHVVDTAGCEFFQDEKTGTMYMNAPSGSTVSCVHTDRHSPVEIPTGIYEFGTQQEYDYLNEHLRKVAD